MKNKQKLPFFGMNFYISNDLSVALFFSFHLPANFTKQQQLQQQQQNYYELKTDLGRESVAMQSGKIIHTQKPKLSLIEHGHQMDG